MDENYTDEFMDEDEDLYVEDENPDPEQEADMHKSIEPDSVDSVEVVRTAVIQENVQPQPMQNVPEPGEQAESDIDKLPYKGYITYLYNLFSDANKGLGHLDEEWKKVRAQVNSALQLKIPRKYIERLISLEYSYEQREVIKFMYFSGCSEEMVADMKPALTYKEMIAKYDATKVESAIVNMLDAPLNTMSRLVNEYKEDLAKYRKETEEKMASYEQQIKEKDMELAETKEELTNLQEEKKAEREKKSKEQLIQMEAEKIAQEMFLAKKKEYDAENRRNQEMEELYHRIDMLEHGADPGNGRQKEKRGWFTGKKSKKQVSGTSPQRLSRNIPLPKDFDISTYMMQSNLSSSQLDVIAMAAKCGLSDQILKDMVDSGKDARALKQIVEVFLAKKEKEMTAGSDIKQEDIVYDK